MGLEKGIGDVFFFFFFFQAEDGIRGLVRSRGLGDVCEGQPARPGLSAAGGAPMHGPAGAAGPGLCSDVSVRLRGCSRSSAPFTLPTLPTVMLAYISVASTPL